ncbi:MAG: HTTM domain-containing protein [Gammaproteobacteria bacterium]|nr:HTTM domain-containing protein [Gammaproteobacteria bacterium]
MSFELAIRLTEILMGFAFIQQSLEHLTLFTNERRLFLARLILSLLLIIGFQTAWILLLLLLLTLAILHRFQGPYNGGADRMSLLILCCLCLVHFSPSLRWQEMAFGYLSLQLILSYFISGWVKVINPDWRSGRALQDVFQFSAYPVSESLRQWSNSPRLLLSMSWGVILFELLFPFSLISSTSLTVALIITASFHFSNSCLFGLNRFFWIWITAYPSILWFHQRIFESFT